MTGDGERTGWMTGADAELLRILSKGLDEEDRRRDGALIDANEREARRILGRRETDR